MIPDIDIDVESPSSLLSAAADSRRVGPGVVVAMWYNGVNGMIELTPRLMIVLSSRGQ